MAPDQSRLHARDGTSAAEASLCRLRAGCRSARPPGAYNPSTLDKSGKRRAAAERGRTYILAAPRLRTIAAEKEALHFPPQLRHGSLQRLEPRIDDDGPLRIQPIDMLADRLAQPPLDAISRHGLAQRARNSKADAGTDGVRLLDTEGREKRAGEPATLVINPSEVWRSQQTDTFRKTGDGKLPFGADGELFPPPSATPRQHRTAILGLHSGTESMRLSALAIVWLKCTLRHSGSSI
jgi:hypothetical protein